MPSYRAFDVASSGAFLWCWHKGASPGSTQGGFLSVPSMWLLLVPSSGAFLEERQVKHHETNIVNAGKYPAVYSTLLCVVPCCGGDCSFELMRNLLEQQVCPTHYLMWLQL